MIDRGVSMSKYENDVRNQAQTESAAQDAKHELASGLSVNLPNASDDPTRSTLHTGQHDYGVLSPQHNPDGAPGTDPGLLDSEMNGRATGGDMPADTVKGQSNQTSQAETVTIPSVETTPQSPHLALNREPIRFDPPTYTDDVSAGPQSGKTETAQPLDPIASPPPPTETTPENNAPEAIALDNSSLAENADGAVVGTLSVTDTDAGDTHRYQLSDDRFEVVDSQLRLKPGVALNHEDEAQIWVDVTATDSGGLSVSERFTIDVQDINEAPTDLRLTTNVQNLVRNGSFEEFDLDQGRWRGFDKDQSGAWTDASGIEIWDRLGGIQASEGDQLMELDHAHGVDSISQVIETKSGQVYDLGLDLRERLAGGTDTVEVYWNGNLVAELDPQSAEWETYQIQVVGTGKDRLELREPDGQNDSYGALVDNITLTEAELTVAENVAGAVIGQISFADPDHGDTHSFEVSDNRFEVVDGQLRLKSDVALDHEQAASVTVDVSVIDAGGLSQTESFTINVADMAEMSFSSGFHAKYIDVDHPLRGLDDVNWDAPATRQEIKSVINYEESQSPLWKDGAHDTFGAQITGNIEVSEGGTFTFHLGGNDGASLTINGVPVVEKDGVHASRTGSGSIELEPGTHTIELRYFENAGTSELKLEWEGPGIDTRELVAAPDIAQAQTVSGMPIAFQVDTQPLGLSEDTQFSLENLPEGTIVEDSGTITIVGADGTVQLEDWQVDQLTLTPPVDFTGTINAALLHSSPTEDGGSSDRSQILSFDVNSAQHIVPEVHLSGGFSARYFDHDHRLTRLDDVNWDADPTHQEFVPEINYENSAQSFWQGGSRDTFGVKLDGQVTVGEAGTYTFHAGGDDGVALYVNGDLIIDNDGLHAYKTASGQVELEPGTHTIEVRYFENYGHAGLKLEWEGPGTSGREVVQAETKIFAPQGGTLDVGLNLTDASDQAVVSLDGLPANTLIISGENAALSDGNPVDLRGWDLDFLEISPPAGFQGVIQAEVSVSDIGFNGAKVTSETTFTFDIGDTELPSGANASLELALSTSAENMDVANATWDAVDPSEGETEDTDVLSEPVVTPPQSEITSIETEAYERVDW